MTTHLSGSPLIRNGKIIGEMKPTGSVPTWIDQLKSRGIEFDMGVFSE